MSDKSAQLKDLLNNIQDDLATLTDERELEQSLAKLLGTAEDLLCGISGIRTKQAV